MVLPAEPVPCRLYFILAREAPVGVVFRRGPSKWVEIIKWNVYTDTFERGQWFHGRIYEKRSDLSPDGTKLIYFAQKISGRTLSDTDYTYSWTAISTPPYLTALVLWPKGDCWHGGGLFETSNKVWLNHRPEAAVPHRDHLPPRGVVVVSNPDACGEDAPVHDRRLSRDGWVIVQEWEGRTTSHGYTTDKPEIREKKHPTLDILLIMRLAICEFDWSYSFAIRDSSGERRVWVDNAEWADWDYRGRLAYVAKGKLFAADVVESLQIHTKELADFCPDTPQPVQAPQEARSWIVP